MDRARELLSVARREAGTDRVWIKSVAFERTQKNASAALELAQDGLDRYPKAAKLHMMKGQIYEYDHEHPKSTQAREAYIAGTRAAPHAPSLWILASRLEEKMKVVVKARSILERARLAVPHEPSLWVESVRVERRAGNTNTAQNLMARALQDVPPEKSGSLWAERIWHLEPRNQRRAVALEAIKKADNDPILFVSVARIFWGERKLEKAASWFEKAVILDSDVGDTWAWYMKFLQQHGEKEKRTDVTNKCENVEPKHGEVWQSVKKDPSNAGKSNTEILKLVMALVDSWGEKAAVIKNGV